MIEEEEQLFLEGFEPPELRICLVHDGEILVEEVKKSLYSLLREVSALLKRPLRFNIQEDKNIYFERNKLLTKNLSLALSGYEKNGHPLTFLILGNRIASRVEYKDSVLAIQTNDIRLITIHPGNDLRKEALRMLKKYFQTTMGAKGAAE